MVCSSCGKTCEDDLEVCPDCGNTLVSSSENLKVEEINKAEVFSKLFTNDLSKNNYHELEQKNGSYEGNYKDHKKSKKIPILILASVIILVLGLFIFIKRDDIFYSKSGKRTIMIYMIGSDLESKYLAATKDIDEIINSSIDYDDVNILIYTGGSKEWHKSEIPNRGHALFEINKDGLVKIEEFDVSNNMLDKDNLTYLLNYGYNNYETEYYDLILWDHGAGPIYGYGYDEYNKLDSMSLDEIRQALYESPFNGGNKLELIGFDACLMSSIEIASVLSDYADYMVASQEFEPGDGWDYSFLKDLNSKTPSVEFGKSIVEKFKDYYEDKKNTSGISLALLKLSKVDNVIKYLDDLFEIIDEDLVIDFSKISRSRSSSKSFGRISNDDYYYDLVDLVDLIDKLPEKYYEQVKSLKTSVNDLVLYQETDLERTNGISIYFPYENKKEIVDNMKLYHSLDFAPSYYKFVSNFSSRLTGNKESDWDLTKSKIVSSSGGEVAVYLPNDVVNNYSSADYIIFEKDKDGYFIPIYNGTDVEVTGNKLSTTISRKALVASNEALDKLNITVIETQRGKDFVKYDIPATLTKWNLENFEFDIIAVYLELIVDEEHPNGYIQNVYPMNVNENYTYSKFEINIKDWNILSLVSNKYMILDELGNYKTNWISAKEVVELEIPTQEELKIEFQDLDISHDFYCLFRIKDSVGKVYYSNIVLVNNK